MVVVGRVGQPSAVLLSRNTDLHFKFRPRSVELDGELSSPQFLDHKGGRPTRRRRVWGGWSKNMAREVPFIVLRPYLGHSNAFAWKINENVWQFHLMWKPHEPQFNCSILCGGAGMPFFIRRSEWQKPLSDQAASFVRTSLFMNCYFYASPCERRQWLHNRKWRINIWGDQTHRPMVQSIPSFGSAFPRPTHNKRE